MTTTTFMLGNNAYGGAVGLLWVDLETTGSDEDLDEIIEIGAVLTNFDFERFDYRGDRDFSCIIEPSEVALGRLMKNPIVQRMHDRNELLHDCLNNDDRFASIEQAEEALIKYISLALNSRKGMGPAERYRFMLAGSGVGHFDNRFIRKYMPRLYSLLVFAPLDVGMVRRFLKVSGVELANANNTDQKNHRALDDICLHIAEAEAYRQHFQKVFAAQSLSGNNK